MSKSYKPISSKYIAIDALRYSSSVSLKSKIDGMNTSIGTNTTNISNITGKIASHIVCDHNGDYTYAAGNGYTVYTRFDLNRTNRVWGSTFTRNGQYIVAQKACVALIGCSFNFDINANVQICLQVNNSTIHTIDSGSMAGMANTPPLLMIYNLNANDKISVNMSFSDSSTHLCRGARSYIFATELYTS